MKKFFLSFPCIYPVCPISIDHSRLYVIGDIYARYYRQKGYEVIFPIGFHYSGLTANTFATELRKSDNSNEIMCLFKNTYKIPSNIINKFKNDPINILDYFSFHTLKVLRDLNISFDYEDFYTTENELFNKFVLCIFNKYESKNVLIHENDNIYLDYTNNAWKSAVEKSFDEISTIRIDEKKNIKKTIEDLHKPWMILKNEGYGVIYDKKDGRIIDSMHDSELLSLFDIINYISKTRNYNFTTNDINKILNIINGEINIDDINEKPILDVINYLPCDMLVSEEHLKVWLVKKVYAEDLLFNSKYRTKKWFITGLGMKDGVRMSASRGTAILTNNLIKDYGPIISRMIILMVGGHPSKFYNFTENIPVECNKQYNKFYYFIVNILSSNFHTNEDYICKFLQISKNQNNENIDFAKRLKKNELYLQIFNKIDAYIMQGYFRQALIEIMVILPKTIKEKNDNMDISILLEIIDYFLRILLGVNILGLEEPKI